MPTKTRFVDLLGSYEKEIHRYAYRMTGNAEDAADVLQDTFLKAFKAFSRLPVDANHRAWLYRIAHHCCIDHWRRSGRTRHREVTNEDALAGLPDTTGRGPADHAMHAQAAEALHAAVAQLPDEQRSAFLMYAEGGLSLAEIADATGVGVETAKSRLRYAAAKLRLAMTAAGQGDGT